MSVDDLFTREEALEGLPARRAQVLLHLMERLSAVRAEEARRAVPLLSVPDSAMPIEGAIWSQVVAEASAAAPRLRDGEDGYLEAFALGREGLRPPTIREIERYAHEWAPLVPASPRLRAAAARLLGRKYRFAARSAPGIRSALGLDDEAVRAAFRQLYGEPLESIYAPAIPPRERLRWLGTAAAKRIDGLPPFWFAFAFTLTETVGSALLALPIALAALGPGPALGVLFLIGLVNLLTVAAMAESVARGAILREGESFLGRLAADFLGPRASTLISAGQAGLCFLVLIAYYIGFAEPVAQSTGLPAPVWIAVLAGVHLYFLRIGSLASTAASAILIGAVSIALVIALSGSALLHADLRRLAVLPRWQALGPSDLDLVFGVVVTAYFGHLSVSNCARLVLRRDPGGRSLVAGCASAQAAAMVLYCLFTAGVTAALGPDALAGQRGTAVEPLAAQLGRPVAILGSLFAVLAMGMASVHFALGLYNLVRERLPQRAKTLVHLTEGGGRAILEPPRGGPGLRLALAYLGAAGGAARFRLDWLDRGTRRSAEASLPARWGAPEIAALFPGDRPAMPEFSAEIVESGEGGVRLLLDTPQRIRQEGVAGGVSPARLLDVPEAHWSLLRWLLRRGEATAADAAAFLHRSPEEAQTLLQGLVGAGLAQRVEEARAVRYVARMGAKRERRLPARIWEALGEPPQPESRDGGAGTAAAGGSGGRSLLSSLRRPLRQGLPERTRAWLSVLPTLAAFLAALWMQLSGASSFSGLLNLAGVLVIPMLSGIFPLLLLASTRRQGEIVPGCAWPVLGSPILQGLLLAFFFGVFPLYGLVIWQDWLSRLLALAAGAAAVWFAAGALRSGALDPHLAIELRAEEEGGRFHVLAFGLPREAAVTLESAEGAVEVRGASGEIPSLAGLWSVRFRLPREGARAVRLWAHRAGAGGGSEPLPALAEVLSGGETARLDLGLTAGRDRVPVRGEEVEVRILLA